MQPVFDGAGGRGVHLEVVGDGSELLGLMSVPELDRGRRISSKELTWLQGWIQEHGQWNLKRLSLGSSQREEALIASGVPLARWPGGLIAMGRASLGMAWVGWGL